MFTLIELKTLLLFTTRADIKGGDAPAIKALIDKLQELIKNQVEEQKK